MTPKALCRLAFHQLGGGRLGQDAYDRHVMFSVRSGMGAGAGRAACPVLTTPVGPGGEGRAGGRVSGRWR
ncbi:hypothetical protein AMK24_29540 [Streptomyces sp. CB02366]|nr:hypothetical protein AMK24_29540 [Streptomyces sp. CB02366]